MSSNGSPAMPIRNRTLDRRSNVIQAARAAVLVAIISAFLPTLSHAQPTVLVDEPFMFSVNNPCLAGEEVLVDGRLTNTFYPRSDGAGGNHLTFRFIRRGKGTTLTNPLQPPKDYVFNSEFVHEMNAPSNGTIEETIILNEILVRKSETDGTADPLLGTGEDFMVQERFHVTVANGVPTVTFTKGQARCM